VAQLAAASVALVFELPAPAVDIDEAAVIMAAKRLEAAWEPAPEEETTAQDEKFFWSDDAAPLPGRLAGVWESNPLSEKWARKKITDKLPRYKGIPKVAVFPTAAGIRRHWLDDQVQSWYNRARDVARAVAYIHQRLESPQAPDDAPKLEDVVEATFGLATSLSKSLWNYRKGLVDRRLKEADNGTGEEVVTEKDWKKLEQYNKVRRNLGKGCGRGSGYGKGYSQYSSYVAPRFSPYKGGKGGLKQGKGKGKARPFPFLQVLNDRAS